MTVSADFQSWVHTRQTLVESTLQKVLPAAEIAPQRLHQAVREGVGPGAEHRGADRHRAAVALA